MASQKSGDPGRKLPSEANASQSKAAAAASSKVHSIDNRVKSAQRSGQTAPHARDNVLSKSNSTQKDFHPRAGSEQETRQRVWMLIRVARPNPHLAVAAD